MTEARVALHTLEYGDAGERVVFLHGLLGQGRNWSTIGRALAGAHRVRLVDLPNHGRSAWVDRVDYAAMADAVAASIEPGEPAAVVGHSMGGKVAMRLALTRPELVSRLVVADMSPVAYDVADAATTGGVLSYARILRDLDLTSAPRREDVERRLALQVSDPTIRAFLMQGLRHDDVLAGWRWAANVDVLARDGAALAGWPSIRATYDGPVLWMAGERSDYVRPEYAAAMRGYFPHVRKVTIKGAGHWLHSERPEVFLEVLRQFLGDSSRDRAR